MAEEDDWRLSDEELIVPYCIDEVGRSRNMSKFKAKQYINQFLYFIDRAGFEIKRKEKV